MLILIQEACSQTSLITNFPEELNISLEDRLALKADELVKSSMAVT